ncbi:MAG: GGDEF domain-containing protein [Faecalibacterium sp.]|jgi:diguanylate cyclase (GGDEF)-like protein|nr:GGDEF domain-containing protein [Faecalibacterium sp.]
MIPLVCASTIGNFPKKKWVMLFLLAHAFLEVLSARFGFIFSVDSSNVYHRRGFYWIYLAAIVLGTAFLFRASFQLSRHYQNRNSHVLALILVFLVVGTAIQIIWRDVRVDWISVSLASMLFYIYYSELIQPTDPLTALLNRRCYESRIAAIHSVVIILYFDVDQFKKINDRYGHACGDSCLSIIGGVLRRSYSKYGCCYRIGGDEFCVILDHHLRDVALLNTSFFSRLTAQRVNQPFLPHVSVGFAQYNPATDDIHEVIAQADSCMYHYKEKHRAAPPLSS